MASHCPQNKLKSTAYKISVILPLNTSAISFHIPLLPLHQTQHITAFFSLRYTKRFPVYSLCAFTLGVSAYRTLHPPDRTVAPSHPLGNSHYSPSTPEPPTPLQLHHTTLLFPLLMFSTIYNYPKILFIYLSFLFFLLP